MGALAQRRYCRVMPDDVQQCSRCGTVQHAAEPCRECAEELECRHLRERLFGATTELPLVIE
jgi:hypothetical protein